MAFYISRARLAMITVVGAISVIAGLILIFRLGTPRNLERLHTWEIVAMLGLLVLPVLTVWAFYADVRARRAAVLSEAFTPSSSNQSPHIAAEIRPVSSQQRPLAGRDLTDETTRAATVRHTRPGDDDPREDHRRASRRPASGAGFERADSRA